MNANKCNLCPRSCKVNRDEGERGFCGAGQKIEIAWYGKHFGEEPVISGKNGSGTLFFCNCNLKCIYCQNWQISHGQIKGKEFSLAETVRLIFELEKEGANNINLVSPTVWAFWLKEVLLKVKEKGLKIPIVWNSNGYEKMEVLREFESLVDIYLPDYKYADEKLAIKYSFAPNYPKIVRQAILEMYRQVEDFRVGDGGFGRCRGLIVRHLVLPGQVENTIECLKFIRTISPKIHLSLMTQYNPLYRAGEFSEINRTLTKEEYERVLESVEDLGFENGWVQEFGENVKCFTPDFRKDKPFEDK